jgi:hypothetical protein
MDNKRNKTRQRVLKAGLITFNGAGINCLVRNISDTGAALEVENQIGIPPIFDLVIALPRRLAQRKANWHRLQFRPRRMKSGVSDARRSRGRIEPAF